MICWRLRSAGRPTGRAVGAGRSQMCVGTTVTLSCDQRSRTRNVCDQRPLIHQGSEGETDGQPARRSDARGAGRTPGPASPGAGCPLGHPDPGRHRVIGGGRRDRSRPGESEDPAKRRPRPRRARQDSRPGRPPVRDRTPERGGTRLGMWTRLEEAPLRASARSRLGRRGPPRGGTAAGAALPGGAHLVAADIESQGWPAELPRNRRPWSSPTD